MNQFGIVILNYNTFEDTLICVESIIRETKRDNYKIFVVDNASPDLSGRKLKEYYKDSKKITVLESDRNLGFSGGNNIGIKEALKNNCDAVFLLNSDIILKNDAFEYMIQIMESNKNVVAVGPSIFNKSNEYAQFARKGLTLTVYLLDKKFLDSIFKKKIEKARIIEFDSAKDIIFEGMVSGCCFGLKSDFIRQSGCLDDTLFMYYEEDILSYQIRNSGKKTAIASKAMVIHNEGVSTSKSSEDKLLFTRMYRWTSSLYVLGKYAKASRIAVVTIGYINIFIWKILAVKNEKYRSSYPKFVQETKRVLRESRRI